MIDPSSIIQLGFQIMSDDRKQFDKSGFLKRLSDDSNIYRGCVHLYSARFDIHLTTRGGRGSKSLPIKILEKKGSLRRGLRVFTM